MTSMGAGGRHWNTHLVKKQHNPVVNSYFLPGNEEFIQPHTSPWKVKCKYAKVSLQNREEFLTDKKNSIFSFKSSSNICTIYFDKKTATFRTSNQ